MELLNRGYLGSLSRVRLPTGRRNFGTDYIKQRR